MANGPVINVDEVLGRLQDKGLDPATAVSCVPSSGLPGSRPGVRGCNVFDRCPFWMKRYGGFKGFGPKNVAYYVKPNDGTKNQKEDFVACNRFVATLWERMRAGERDRQDGKPGEIIEIIGVEGSQISQRVWVPVDEDDKRLTAAYKTMRRLVTVPLYEHEDDARGDTYEAELERRRIERMQSDPDYQRKPLPSERSEDTRDDETWQLEGEPEEVAATAEPVKAEPVVRKK